jgi:hypothetical protein
MIYPMRTSQEEQELELLAVLVINSNKQAIKSLKEAHKAIQDTLSRRLNRELKNY